MKKPGIIIAMVVCAASLQTVSSNPAHAQDKAADGAACTTPSMCSSNYCYPGPADNTQFCMAQSANCAVPNSSGARDREIVDLNGRKFICARPQGSPPRLVLARRTGEECKEDVECVIGRCYAGPSGDRRFCMAPDRNCAAPGSEGARFGELLNLDGRDLICARAPGNTGATVWRAARHLGQQCEDDDECSSGRCYLGPSGNMRFCMARDRNCAAPGSAGVRFGELFRLDGRDLICAKAPDNSSAVVWRVARHVGQQCQDDDECSSGRCSLGPSNDARFCVAQDRNCATPGSPGVRFGELFRLDGRDLICAKAPDNSSAVVWRAARHPGQQCQDDDECSSGRCSLGPSNDARFCVARDQNCAIPNSPGRRYGEIYAAGDKELICFQQRGTGGAIGTDAVWRIPRRLGETCGDKTECSTGSCLPGPPDNSRNYCSYPDDHCGVPGRAGLHVGEAIGLGERYYRCKQTTANKVYRWEPYDPIFLKPKNTVEIK